MVLEALKVTQQCKVASSAARDTGYAALPPSLTTQSQGRTLGKDPKRGFIICSPCRQVPQSLPSWVCHHHLDWHRPNSNTGARHSARPLKCLCAGTRSHNSLTSSRLLTASWTIRGPLTLCLKLKGSPNLELPLLPCPGMPNTRLRQGSQNYLNSSKYITLTQLFSQASSWA